MKKRKENEIYNQGKFASFLESQYTFLSFWKRKKKIMNTSPSFLPQARIFTKVFLNGNLFFLYSLTISSSSRLYDFLHPSFAPSLNSPPDTRPVSPSHFPHPHPHYPNPRAQIRPHPSLTYPLHILQNIKLQGLRP